MEGRKCKDEWLIEGVILEWDPAILSSIATHYSFISTESLATKRVHFLFNDALKDQKITLSLASNNQGNSKTISDPEINLDLRRKKSTGSNESLFDSSFSVSASFNQFVLNDWLDQVLLEKQVTINGTVDLNQFKLTGFEDEYELNVLFPRVDVGELQYTNVVLNLAPDTAQIHLSELISDAKRQQFKPYSINAKYNSEFGRLSWEGKGRYGSSMMEIESTFQMDSLRLYSKPQDTINVTQKTQNTQAAQNYIIEKNSKVELNRSVPNKNITIPAIIGSFNVSFENNKLSEGVLSADIPAIITHDTTWLDRQFFIDYIAESPQRQQIRVTSSPLDFQVEGVINTQSMSFLFDHWSNYLKEWNRLSFSELQEAQTIAQKESTRSESNRLDSVSYQTQLEWKFSLKDNELVKVIWAKHPIQKSSMVVSGRLDANRDRILMNVDTFDPDFQWNELKLDSINSQLTASFRYDSTILDFSVVESRNQC